MKCSKYDVGTVKTRRDGAGGDVEKVCDEWHEELDVVICSSAPVGLFRKPAAGRERVA